MKSKKSGGQDSIEKFHFKNLLAKFQPFFCGNFQIFFPTWSSFEESEGCKRDCSALKGDKTNLKN